MMTLPQMQHLDSEIQRHHLLLPILAAIRMIPTHTKKKLMNARMIIGCDM